MPNDPFITEADLNRRIEQHFPSSDQPVLKMDGEYRAVIRYSVPKGEWRIFLAAIKNNGDNCIALFAYRVCFSHNFLSDVARSSWDGQEKSLATADSPSHMFNADDLPSPLKEFIKAICPPRPTLKKVDDNQ